MTQWFSSYFEALVSLTLEMSPYLLLGFLVAGILHVFVPKSLFTKWLGGNNLKSVVRAAIIGIPLPLCSCGVIPTGISLYKDGASKGSTVSFLISTPQTGVDSILVTYSLLGLPFAIIRPFMSLITGMIGGIGVNALEKTDTSGAFVGQTEEKEVKKSIKSVFNYAFDEFMRDLIDWLVIGLALAALIAVVIPNDFFSNSYFANPWLSMALILVASIPFYVCATGSVPIAAVLLLKGLNPGAALVFLMAGPATNIATMTVISQTLGKKTLAIYLGTLVLASFIFGGLLDAFFPIEYFTISEVAFHHHQNQTLFWIEVVSALLFVSILAWHYIRRIGNYMRVRKGKNEISSEKIELEVKGMSCSNCANKVESTLLKLDGINETHANFEDDKVSISGQNLNLDKVKASIEEAGYTYSKVLSE